MNTSCTPIHKKIDTTEDESEMKVQCRHSFPAPDWMGLVERCDSREVDYGSTSTKCTSAWLRTRPMSASESTGGDKSSSYQTDPTIRCKTSAHQVPQVVPAGTQFYQPMSHNQQLQFQQGYTIPCAKMGLPSCGYEPVQVQSMPMSLPLHHQLQPNQVVYPLQQCQQIPKKWVPMPLSPTVVPCMVGPVSYSQQSNHASYVASPSVVSSTVSTPILSYSTPSYSNPYGYIKTPVLSSATSTPMQYPMTCPEVPPVLNLDSYSQAGIIPQRMSCNINMGPIPSECTSASEIPASECLTSRPPLTEKNFIPEEEEDNLWQGPCNYVEYQQNGGSNLFITWSGSKAKLVEKLKSFKLKVRDICNTCDEKVCNVIFESHPIARKAFTMQNQIRLRIVPPENSHRMWLRNPSPKFVVMFETKRKLIVRRGKAECHDIVGELLKGCLICADQLKGNRIRVACCEGSFLFPGGKIVEMKGIPDESDEKVSLGWISHRCKDTKESLVKRRSWNRLSDYIYQE